MCVPIHQTFPQGSFTLGVWEYGSGGVWECGGWGVWEERRRAAGLGSGRVIPGLDGDRRLAGQRAA
jgi:hypothetical protein